VADVWSFLLDENNRTLLAWIGSGVVVIAGGVWAIVKFVLSKKSGDSASSPTVSASHGGVAAGRDIRGNIDTGRREKQAD
jgi:hypothetical protein